MNISNTNNWTKCLCETFLVITQCHSLKKITHSISSENIYTHFSLLLNVSLYGCFMFIGLEWNGQGDKFGLFYLMLSYHLCEVNSNPAPKYWLYRLCICTLNLHLNFWKNGWLHISLALLYVWIDEKNLDQHNLGDKILFWLTNRGRSVSFVPKSTCTEVKK